MDLNNAARWWARLYVKNLGFSVLLNVAFVLLEIESYPGPAWFALRVVGWGGVFLCIDVGLRRLFGEESSPPSTDA